MEKYLKVVENFLGRICIHGRANINKFVYRSIDFFRRINKFGFICKIFYDNNRSAFIGLILYINGLASYIILSNLNNKNDFIYSGSGINCNYLGIKNDGWALPLSEINLFTLVSNIEIKPFSGIKLLRSAGCSGLLIKQINVKIYLKLKSGWEIILANNCIATIGIVSNSKHKFDKLIKAGKKRAAGFSSKVRGVAKNPCDHPHGGGNGKKSPPVVPVTAWGRVAKWRHTNEKKIDKKKRQFYKKY